MVHNPSKVYTFRRDDLVAAFAILCNEDDAETELDAFMENVRTATLKRESGVYDDEKTEAA